jgi:HD-like signal output (HDOD) protein
MSDIKQFLHEINTALKANKINLPTLPEVALKVRDALESDDVSSTGLAEIIATDVAISARLLQVANSPLYRVRSEIDNVQMAVTRMGLKTVKDLVTTLAMRQMFQATSELLDRRFRAIWKESIDIAAMSRVLASNAPHLDKEQAMLAGLIHNVGALPILTFAEQQGGALTTNRDLLDRYIENLSPLIGRAILAKWKFPESLVDVAAHCRDLSYDSGTRADYVDVVLVARLELAQKGPSDQELTSIKAFQKLDLEQGVQVIELEGVAEEFEEVKVMLNS